jgi:ABC-type uncharacterized transport system permease subunit
MSDSRLNPPLQELLTSIATDVQLLASQTLTLARLEIAAAASTLAWSAIAVVASVFVAIAGLAVLVSALVLILIALGLPAWAASNTRWRDVDRVGSARGSLFRRIDAKCRTWYERDA